MDKLGSMLGGGGSSGGGQQAANPGGEDYGDKGLDAIEKKFGEGKVDPNKMRSTNEKITDGAREQFEKLTGKNVPEKFSN